MKFTFVINEVVLIVHYYLVELFILNNRPREASPILIIRTFPRLSYQVPIPRRKGQAFFRLTNSEFHQG